MLASAQSRARIVSVDVVRGVVMVLMALDHVRDYVTNLRFQPEDLSRGTAALFATRWVTHFCAPAFFLLAGIGIGLSVNRGAKPRDVSRYLITRGLWLLVLDMVITPIGWQFGFRLIPAFALALTERARGRFADWLAVYGRVPLFYYAGHIVVAHIVAMALALAQSGELRRVPIIHDPGAVPASHGVGLAGVYVAWMIVVLLMYYPCREFARLKETRTDWWLRYS